MSFVGDERISTGRNIYLRQMNLIESKQFLVELLKRNN